MGIKICNPQYFYTLFFTKYKISEVITIKFKSFEDVKEVYGEENLIKICNLKQIITYAKLNVQPVWIDEGYKGKLIGYYFAPETKKAWEYWKASTPPSSH